MQPAREFEHAKFSLFQAIVEQAPDAIIFADRDGAIQVWNRGAETVFGYAAAEVLGKSLNGSHVSIVGTTLQRSIEAVPLFRSGVVAMLKSGLLLTVSSYAVGRICLHLAAMIGDREIKWHWSGIGRELSRFSVRRGSIASSTAN